MRPRWLKSVEGSGSFAQLRSAVEANAARFGFRYFIYHGCFPGTRAGANVHFDNGPESWREFYRALDEGDRPLRLREPYEVAPRLWSQMAQLAPGFFEAARRLGLATGATHAVHGPRGEWSSVSFVKDRGGLRAEYEIRATLAGCQLLASYVHDRVGRMVEERGSESIAVAQPAPDAGDLNERERQVLTWAAAGKTTAEIASLMPISRRTVIFHLSNARRKLGAANSRHAITRAISLGLIDARSEARRAPGGAEQV